MKITYYTIPNGGQETHIKYLLNYFDAKLFTSKILYNFWDKTYCITRGMKQLKKEMESCDIFHIHHTAGSLEFLIPFIFKKLNKKPVIINTFHTSVGTYMKLITTLYKKISSKFIVVGERQREIIEDIVGEKVILIRNGIDTKKFKKKKARRFFKDFTVGYLGRLHWEKNVINLIKACKKANVNLVIGGSGIQFKKIKKMENEKLKVLGFVKDPDRFLNSIDVLASSSYLEAGIPYAILEAMACEKPVIASNCGGGEEKLKDCGIICGTKVEEVKKAILEIKNRDLEKLGKKGRKLIEKEYNIERQIEELRKVYKSVLRS